MYQDNDLLSTITETGVGGVAIATTSFIYDSRHRLTHETRTAQPGYVSYEHGYTYDQGGNRLVKSNVLTNQWDQYSYDYDDPQGYESDNNRLEKIEHYGGIFPAVLTGTTYYYYNDAGNVTRIVEEPVDDGGECASLKEYTATRFVYAKNCETVTQVVGEEWCWNSVGTCEDVAGYTVTFAREFRYDGSRQRYFDREYDPVKLNWSTPDFTPLSETWSDYDGNDVHGDYTVSGGGTDVRSYEPGLAKVDPWTISGSSSTDYYHNNHLGTTRFMTDSAGADIEHVAYTAFGERISGNARRYGYDGAWGYQGTVDSGGGESFPCLHLGARYYDPMTGRFLQRDPIGIGDGKNVYGYVEGRPAGAVDPEGLFLETFVDVGFVAYDLWNGNWVDLGWDLAALAIPCVPAGGSRFLKALKKARKPKEPGQQYEEILDAQYKLRKRGQGKKIESTKKSKQKDKQELQDAAG